MACARRLSGISLAERSSSGRVLPSSAAGHCGRVSNIPECFQGLPKPPVRNSSAWERKRHFFYFFPPASSPRSPPLPPFFFSTPGFICPFACLVDFHQVLKKMLFSDTQSWRKSCIAGWSIRARITAARRSCWHCLSALPPRCTPSLEVSGVPDLRVPLKYSEHKSSEKPELT